MKLTFTFLSSLFFCTLIIAQEATVRGKVTDGQSGEPLIGATVALNQAGASPIGTLTDIDGAYSISVSPGEYQLVISYIGYASDTLNIEAVAGEVVANEIFLDEKGNTLETAIITARARQSSYTAISLLKQNSNNTIDGISSDFIQRTGDRDLAAAVPRITGVSIEGGRYVTVRGLGDRYSKTILNGGELPALDVERNTTQLDIFPSALVDNIIVYKNFSPDLPGSFTGGLVDIRTKSHPTEFELSFSASVSYNPTANLRDDFLSYDLGRYDALGFDDGQRALPDFIRNGEADGFVIDDASEPSGRDTIFNLINSRTVRDSATAFLAEAQNLAFPDFYTIQEKRSGLNQNYQFSIGNQLDLFNRPFGYILGLSYRRGFQYNEDYTLGRFQLNRNDPFPFEERIIEGVVTEEEALWGAILGLSYKPSTNHKFTFNYMRNQSGINQTRQQSGTEEFNLGKDDLRLDATQSFVERSLNTFQLRADHLVGKLNIDWIGTYTRSTDDQPDFRIIQYLNRERIEGAFVDGVAVIDTVFRFDLDNSINRDPSRYYRELDEDNFDFKLNLKLPINIWANREASIGIGGAYTYKDRSFTEDQYAIIVHELDSPENDFSVTGDVDAAFDPSRFDIEEVTSSGSYRFNFGYSNIANAFNTYFADQTIYAGYTMLELPLLASLRLIAGARLETTEINIETAPQPDGTIETGSINEVDILPAANLVYNLGDNMNLRGGYSRTLARPSFRELAPYENFAFFGDFLLRGNPNIERTLIDNYDLRYEWFPAPGELFSISAFYKLLDQPIERFFTTSSQRNVSYTNVDQAESYGFEVEIRKNLGFIAGFLRSIQLSGNFTYLESMTELDTINLGLSNSFNTETDKPLFGQPSYTLNGELAYANIDRPGFQASVSYNIFGQRMVVAGAGNFNVFEQPRGLLNATVRQRFGERWSVRFRARNLLDPEFRQFYLYTQRDGEDEEFPFENFRRGRSFSLGFTYTI